MVNNKAATDYVTAMRMPNASSTATTECTVASATKATLETAPRV
ncbi:unnamed protein product [Nippostrongylus brasiliensis]|uniref:Uncharacterized protein n=1 Tax=Nippostrongylus brasiliensis TaxID=27835 RepID=A0A0N4XQC1_NIPBR|nr:unnamed protein product [Nippostrongylus brasiliensis]